MSIPLSDTTITVQRVPATVGEDGYDPNLPAPTTIASGIRAVISPPSASVVLSGGDRVVYTAQLRCDPTSILPDDTVIDAVTGLTWSVLWARQVTSVGLDFVHGQLRLVEGET